MFTKEQIEEVFELVELASPKQREEFLANLRLEVFEDKQTLYFETWIDGVTDGESPKERLEKTGNA